jgi:cell division septum initiation protein DivIVA
MEKSETPATFAHPGSAGKEAHARLDSDWYQGYDAWDHVTALSAQVRELREENERLRAEMTKVALAHAGIGARLAIAVQSLATAREEALEEAAKVCEKRVAGEAGEAAYDYEALRCARNIRALKHTEAGGGETNGT